MHFHLSFLAVVLNYIFIPSVIEGSGFKIYWNAPSSLCSVKFGINVTDTLISHNVLVNRNEDFLGDKIVIFYENKLGNYPYIDPKHGDVNGGIPQLGNLEEHLEVAKNDIQRIISNQSFNGLGIIDWEQWRPIWEFNWGNMRVYKIRTIELIKKKHPSWSYHHVENAAKIQWEDTTRQWMLKTLELAMKMRPEGRWCFYHFPDCYNYLGKDFPGQFLCNQLVKKLNDRLLWLWNETTALCPSIYFDERQVKYNESQRIWFLYGRLAEVLRVSQPTTPIYPYINYKVRTSLEDVPENHFWIMLAHLASLGLDGAVIWGSSSYVQSESDCKDLELYVKKVIGPASYTVSSNVDHCRKTICNDRGFCTWPHQPYDSWKYLANSTGAVFNPEEITCRCQTHKGRYCNLSTNYSNSSTESDIYV